MGLERFLYPCGQRDLILSCPGKSFESPTHLFQQLRLISELGGPGVGRLGSPKAGEASATLPSPNTVTSDPSPCGRLGASSARTRHAAHGGNPPVCNGKRPRGTSNPPPPAALCPSARTPEPYCRESTCVDPRRIFTTTTGTSGSMAGSTSRPTSQDVVGHRGCQG